MAADRAHLQALSGIRRELASPMRKALPALGDEVIARIRESVPEYAQPLEGRFGEAVRTGVGVALRRFVDDVERPGEDSEGWRTVYENLGRGEYRQGRTLEALLAAYRLGARVSWRRIADAATDAGATATELASLAEAIFAYIDELSSLSAEGYSAERAESVGERQRQREELVRLLIVGASPDAIAGLADEVGWPMPASAAALVAADTAPGALATRLGHGVIAASLDDGAACAIVPDPGSPGRNASLAAAIGDSAAAIGPEVPSTDLGVSFARARLALDVVDEAGLGPGLIASSDHLPTLILHRDPALLSDLAHARLGALLGETEPSRVRLVETLRAWVDHPGKPTEVARAVHVHPQTARYRLRRLRELLGEIDDPNARFELSLALRAPEFSDRGA
jgi:PucR C-terminal helix-turn-helix domain